MNLPDAIEKLITEHGSATILRDHLALVRDQAKAVVEENEKLKRRVVELEDVVRSLTTELRSKKTEEEFVEHRGALFKKKPGGGYHLAVYCPNCRQPAGSIHAVMPFSCGQRHWSSAFTSGDLEKILKELPT